MQGTWKTKKKHIQKDKFKQITQIMRFLEPKEFSKELTVDFLEDYKLKQSKCPNNSLMYLMSVPFSNRWVAKLCRKL